MSSDRAAVLLALDVGGTHCRVRAARYRGGDRRGGELEPHPRMPEVLSRKIASREALAALVHEILGLLPRDARPTRATVAAAGPVQDGRRVRLTNWVDAEPFDLEDLASWGLPSSGTILVNDVVAAAHGLIRLLGREGLASTALVPLAGGAATADGNRVMIVPGTGLGTAGIVRCAGVGMDDRWQPVPSETGHGPVALLGDDHAEVVDRLRADAGGHWPSWERFVSGPGLVSVYRNVRGAYDGDRGRSSATESAQAAPEIARAALDGSDPDAVRALDLYYRCLGGFAQMMALAFTARGGIFIGGASTRRNFDFIVRGRLLAEVRENAVQRDLLAAIPVYLVLRSLNLLGGLALAADACDADV